MKKRSFTLIEILICLAIMALVGGFALFKGFHVYKDVQARSSKERFDNEIQLTKVLSLTHQMDIKLRFTKKGNKLVLTRTSDYVPRELRPYFDRAINFPYLEWKGPTSCIFYSNNPSSFDTLEKME